MPVNTGFGALNIGKDVVLDIVLPDNSILNVAILTGFTRKQNTKELDSKGLDGVNRLASIMVRRFQRRPRKLRSRRLFCAAGGDLFRQRNAQRASHHPNHHGDRRNNQPIPVRRCCAEPVGRRQLGR